MTLYKTDLEPIWDYEQGRWLCSDDGMAATCSHEHPGDYIYTYERDKHGNMINIIPYWTPTMPDTNKITSIRGGRIRQRS